MLMDRAHLPGRWRHLIPEPVVLIKRHWQPGIKC